MCAFAVSLAALLSPVAALAAGGTTTTGAPDVSGVSQYVETVPGAAGAASAGGSTGGGLGAGAIAGIAVGGLIVVGTGTLLARRRVGGS